MKNTGSERKAKILLIYSIVFVCFIYLATTRKFGYCLQTDLIALKLFLEKLDISVEFFKPECVFLFQNKPRIYLVLHY